MTSARRSAAQCASGISTAIIRASSLPPISTLADATLHPQGIICLDDMLHPGYPLLVVAVHEWLERHPDWRVLCVIDREDIVAAAKFMLCHKDVVPLFEQDLMDTFKAQHFVLGSEWERYFCVVLTPQPRLAEVD